MNKYKYKDLIYAEKVYKEGFLTKYRDTELKLVALYMRDVLGITKKQDRKEALHNFCKEHLPDYHKMKYYKVINRVLEYSCTKKNFLITIDNIPVLQSEIDFINTQDLSLDEKKLLFTLLITYKLRKTYFEIKTPEKPFDNLYFRCNKLRMSELKKVSNIHKNLDINIDIISTLIEAGYIESCKVGTIRLNFIEMITPKTEMVAFEITEYNNIGYWLELYNGNKRIKKCIKCGNVFYKVSNSQIYCADCKGYEKVGTKKVICCDCGKEFEVTAKNNSTNRCSDCYTVYRKLYYKLKKQEQRQKN